MTKQVSQLRLGVILSYVNLALSSLIPMFYTPILLQILGQAEHGLYSLASSTVSYLSLLNFGFGSTIVRYMSKFRAENNQEAIRRTYGFFLVLYGSLALLVLAAGVVLTQSAPLIFANSLSAAELEKVLLLIPIMVVHTAVGFPMSVSNSLVLSHERFLFRRIMDILITLVTPIFNLITLFLGYASVGLAVSSILIQLLFSIPTIVYCTSQLRILPSFRPIPKALAIEMVGFSAFVFLDHIVDMLFWATDKVILGILAGSAVVSVYQIGSMFNTMVLQFSSSISSVLAPRITGMVVKNSSNQELTDLFIRVGRVQFLISGLIVSGFTVFGFPFVVLWAGEEYKSAYWITVMTLFPLCVPLIQNTGRQILLAKNQHRFRSVIYLIIAIVNMVFTWLVVPRWGGVGAAFCSCISYLVGHGIVMNIYYYRIIGLDIPLFWKEIGKMAVVPAVLSITTLAIQQLLVFDGWLIFFTGVIVYSVLYCVGVYFFCMNNYEKSLIQKPLAKVLQLCRRK